MSLRLKFVRLHICIHAPPTNFIRASSSFAILSLAFFLSNLNLPRFREKYFCLISVERYFLASLYLVALKFYSIAAHTVISIVKF